MTWNWQQKEWPQFKYDKTALEELEAKFLHQSGVFIGTYKHLSQDDQNFLKIELISDEALKTAEIEGEYLDRDSLQSSIRRNFGLATDNKKVPLAEQGMAEMMVDVYKSFSKPLSHEILFNWHTMLMRGRSDLKIVGGYRIHEEPMQIVSGASYDPKVHFEAPPSKDMPQEMEQFIQWFNQTSPDALPYLTRTGIAHFYFVCIHPFEDGNGRIGRALAEKVLAQSLKHPTLIALSHTIQSNRKAYYAMLGQHNKTNEITEWLKHFAETVLAAQVHTENLISFIIKKTKFYDNAREKLNPRQEKIITSIFQEGFRGFEGGLSAENYISITHTSRATATRDLQDLVDKGLFKKVGELKGTRYSLEL